MAYVLQQTDTAATHAAAAYGSGASSVVPSAPSRAMTSGGAPGTTAVTLNPTTTSQVLCTFESAANAVDGLSCPAGTWTVPVEVSTAFGFGDTISGVYVQQLDSTGTFVASIGSTTTAQAIDSAGVKTFTVSGGAVTFSTGDRVMIVVVAAGGTMGSGAIKPSQAVSTPLVVPWGPAASGVPLTGGEGRRPVPWWHAQPGPAVRPFLVGEDFGPGVMTGPALAGGEGRRPSPWWRAAPGPPVRTYLAGEDVNFVPYDPSAGTGPALVGGEGRRPVPWWRAQAGPQVKALQPGDLPFDPSAGTGAALTGGEGRRPSPWWHAQPGPDGRTFPLSEDVDAMLAWGPRPRPAPPPPRPFRAAEAAGVLLPPGADVPAPAWLPPPGPPPARPRPFVAGHSAVAAAGYHALSQAWDPGPGTPPRRPAARPVAGATPYLGPPVIADDQQVLAAWRTDTGRAPGLLPRPFRPPGEGVMPVEAPFLDVALWEVPGAAGATARAAVGQRPFRPVEHDPAPLWRFAVDAGIDALGQGWRAQHPRAWPRPAQRQAEGFTLALDTAQAVSVPWVQAAEAGASWRARRPAPPAPRPEPWLQSLIIVVAGPYYADAAAVFCAGAVAGGVEPS